MVSHAPDTSPASTAITALRAAAERGDADAVAELLAPDVVFRSPIIARLRFEGKEEVTALHRDIFAVLEDLETSEPLALDDMRSFSFRARVRGVELEAVNLVRFDEHGQIVELKVFVRPLPSLATLFATLPPRVAARRRGRAAGALVALVTRPLAFAVRTADRFAPRLV
ncbi:MAG: nuclear transport factor 2 family protein [Actinomycetota bacterium]|nr:nuclear transport factor 2 family protein [Actinomycetota bacterium]